MRHALRRTLPLAALVLGGVLLRADGLADLKAALKNLPAPTKVRMKIEEDSTEREDGKDRTERRTVVVEDGPEGTQILEDSRPAMGPSPKKGGSKGPGGKRNGDFREALRPAEGLLEQLEKARLLSEKAEPYEGHPARRLKLALDLDMDAEARSHMKQADHEATVWIGQDGLPLAMSHHIEVKARVLLFASVWTKVDIQRRFQRHQDRLLLLDEQADVQGSALGKAFSAKETSRFTLLP
jgi:hypothetical protein